MIGIIRKDLINIRKTVMISMLIILISQIGILLQVSSGKTQASNSLFVISILFFAFSSTGEAIFQIDERSNSENFYRTLPITSNDYVSAKYISILILDVFMFILSSIIIYISYKTIDAINITINLSLIFGIYSFLTFPLNLKYKNKAIRVIVAVFFVLYVMYTYFNDGFNKMAKIFLDFNISVQVILALFFVVSFILCKKITVKILEESF